MKLYRARFAQTMTGGSTSVREEAFYLPNETAVRKHLRSKGLWPISIREQKPPMFEWMDIRSREWQIQLLRALRFQTATSSAGTALLNIIEGESDPRRRLAFLPTRTVLKGGGSFADALKALHLMDAATMAIIAAGERAGDLKGVIQHAIEHVDEKGKQYKAVVAALGWLSFDIISIVGSIWGTQFGFIPYLRKQGSKSTEPGAAEKFEQGLNMATWMNGTLLVIITAIMVGGGLLAVLWWANRHKSDHFTSRLLIKTPIVASYMRNVSMQDSCKLVSRLLRGKVPLADALKIIAESTVEPSSRQYWRECRNRIMAGMEPSRALATPPMEKSERDQLLTVQSVDQLSEVYAAIAEERTSMAKTDRRKVVMMGIMSMIVLSGATVLTMVYLLMLQNEGILNSLSEMKGG